MASIGVVFLTTNSNCKRLKEQRQRLDQLMYGTAVVDVLSTANTQFKLLNFLRRLLYSFFLSSPKLTQKLAVHLNQWRIFAEIQDAVRRLHCKEYERIVIYAPSALAGLFAILFVEQRDYWGLVDNIIAYDAPLVAWKAQHGKFARPYYGDRLCRLNLFFSNSKEQIVQSSLRCAMDWARDGKVGCKIAVEQLAKAKFGFADGAARNFFGWKRFSTYNANYAFATVCSLLVTLQRASAPDGTLA